MTDDLIIERLRMVQKGYVRPADRKILNRLLTMPVPRKRWFTDEEREAGLLLLVFYENKAPGE